MDSLGTTAQAPGDAADPSPEQRNRPSDKTMAVTQRAHLSAFTPDPHAILCGHIASTHAPGDRAQRRAASRSQLVCSETAVRSQEPEGPL